MNCTDGHTSRMGYERVLSYVDQPPSAFCRDRITLTQSKMRSSGMAGPTNLSSSSAKAKAACRSNLCLLSLKGLCVTCLFKSCLCNMLAWAMFADAQPCLHLSQGRLSASLVKYAGAVARLPITETSCRSTLHHSQTSSCLHHATNSVGQCLCW